MKRVIILPIILLSAACSFRAASSSAPSIVTNTAWTNNPSIPGAIAALTNLPVITFLSPAVNQSVFGICAVSFTASCTAGTTNSGAALTLRGSNLTLSYGGVTNTGSNYYETWSANFDTTVLADGWYPAVAVVTDPLGRKASNATTVLVNNASRLTATYPASQTTNLAAGSYLTNPVFTFSGKASVGVGSITNLIFTLSNGSYSTNLRLATNASNFVWSFTLSLSAFSDGPLSLLTVASAIALSGNFTNATNNSATASWMPFSVDLNNPYVTLPIAVYQTNLRRANWTLSANAYNPGSGLSVIYTTLSNSAGIFPDAIAANGATNFPFYDTYAITRGTNLLQVWAVDRAGRTGPVSNILLVGGNDIPMNDDYNDFSNTTDLFSAESFRSNWITWDSNYLYLGFASENMMTNYKNYYVAIATNTNAGSSRIPYDEWDTGSTVWLGFPADFVYFFCGTNGNVPEMRKIVWNGSAWGPGTPATFTNGVSYSTDASADATGYVASSFSKYRISLSALGNPSQVYLTTWARDIDNSNNPGWGWFFGACPANEAGSSTTYDGINDRAQPRWISLNLSQPASQPNDPSHLYSAMTPHTILIDGLNDFFPQYEQILAGDGKTNFFTWDSTNLYFALESEDFTISNKVFCVAVSTNTNYGVTNMPYGQWFEGSTVDLPWNAQFLFTFKRTNSGTEVRYSWTWPGGSWANTSRVPQSTAMGSYCTTTYSEFTLSQSLIGNPAGRIFIVIWEKDLNQNNGWGWLFGACPEPATPINGINDLCLSNWIEADLSAPGVPNLPSNLKP
jgi:hypothetical protein